jgi:hypothetical protein
LSAAAAPAAAAEEEDVLAFFEAGSDIDRKRGKDPVWNLTVITCGGGE